MAGGSSLQKLRDNPAGEGSLTDGWFKLTSGHWALSRNEVERRPWRPLARDLQSDRAACDVSGRDAGRCQMARGGEAAAGCFIGVGVANPVAAHDPCAVRAREQDRHLVPLTMWVRRYNWLGFGAAAYARGIAPTKPPDPSQTL